MKKNRNNKLLISRPNSQQAIPLINAIKSDPYFIENVNYFLGNNPPYKKRQLRKFKIITCDNNPKHIMGKDYKKTDMPKKQIMIQFTHGVWVKQPSPFLYKKKGNIDYILSPCNYQTELYKKMGYEDDEILKFGYMRLEFYKNLDNDIIWDELIKQFNNIKRNEKFSIFAPSWIKVEEEDKNITYNLDEILKKIPKNQKLLIAPHTLTNRNGVKINFTKSEDFKNDLLILPNNMNSAGHKFMMVAESLITDFSSIYFDFKEVMQGKNAYFYNPIFDDLQSDRTKEIYKKIYSKWGTGITDISGYDESDFIHYNNSDTTKAAVEMKNFIKSLLK